MTWLQQFYFLRAGVAVAWISLVVITAPASLPLAGALLVLYPAWDAFANWLDARQSGGLAFNKGQTFNMIVSAVTAICMSIAVGLHGNAGGVLVFGSWALLAGVFQLVVGISRRKLGGQVFMMISGAQSALAGIVFIYQSFRVAPGLVQLTGYAAFGAFYFLAAALWLTFKKTAQHAPYRDARFVNTQIRVREIFRFVIWAVALSAPAVWFLIHPPAQIDAQQTSNNSQKTRSSQAGSPSSGMIFPSRWREGHNQRNKTSRPASQPLWMHVLTQNNCGGKVIHWRSQSRDALIYSTYPA